MSLLFPKRLHRIVRHKEEAGFLGLSKRFFLWLALATSNLIWGHGERPARTLFCGIFLILLSAFFYSRGHLLENGVIFKPDLFESLYFSVITFTTVGYGDFSPCGLSKLVVMIEAFCGIFIIPLFVVGLSRKYLRL